MYIKDNEPKYYETESNAPRGWVANKIIVRNDDNKIIEVKVQDDNEQE